MIRGARKDYDFDDKNRWVRMIWNQVLRRTKGREQSEIIVYLAGPDDFDREIATRRGVPSRNLVAVDIDQANIDRVRSAGHSGICGDVVDVLKAWPSNRPICAIVLDLCRGFQCLADLDRIAALQIMNPALSRAVIAINLQRGRDAESNAAREVIGSMIKRQQETPRSAGGANRTTTDVLADRYKALIDGLDAKHRGLLFAMWSLAIGFKRLGTCGLAGSLAANCGGMGAVMLIILLDFMKPRFFSYRSSGRMVYDSVVMYSLSEFLDVDRSVDLEPVRDFIGSSPRSVAMSTAATLAVRTRRMNEANR